MGKIITVVLLGLLMNGCETASQAYTMSQKGAAGFSCAEINSAFAAYQRDRQAVESLAVLTTLISANSNTATTNLSTTSDAYYEQAKASANIALLVQGCPAMP